jgi:hypothetical protein
MSIGDISSTERGSGARFNTGKPPMELVAVRVIAQTWGIKPDVDDLSSVMFCLADIQEGGGVVAVARAIDALGEPWEDCARVFDYGRSKYAAWNWAKGMPWSVPLACAVRHLLAMRRGEVNDRESGLPHAGHVLCNLVMLATYMISYPEGNDLPSALLWTADAHQMPKGVVETTVCRVQFIGENSGEVD